MYVVIAALGLDVSEEGNSCERPALDFVTCLLSPNVTELWQSNTC